MKCLKCWKDSKREFCRECKTIKHNTCAMLSQNKKKLVKLLDWDWLSPEWFDKFLMYTNNIIKYGKIYMEYKDIKRDKIFRGIAKWLILTSSCISLWCVISLVIIRL